MLTEPLSIKLLKKRHKLSKSLALYNASVISQMLVDNPKGNLGKILEEMLDRNVKVDKTTLSEVIKMQRFFHHHSKKLQKALSEAQFARYELGDDKMTSENVDRRKTLQKFKDEGSATDEQLKELARLNALAAQSKQIEQSQLVVDTLNEEVNSLNRAEKAIEKFRRRRNKVGYNQFLMDDSEFGELTDEDFKKKVAENHIYDNLEYIKNNIENNNDYSDQQGVERAIENLKLLKAIFEQRDREQNPWEL